MRALVYFVLKLSLLVVVWCLLWQSFSYANLLSGTAIGLLLVRRRGITGSVRLVPFVNFVRLLVIDLVISTWDVLLTIFKGNEGVEEKVIEIAHSPKSSTQLYLLVVAITSTPGTAVIDVDKGRSTMRLHLLHGKEEDAVRSHVAELSNVIDEFLPTPISEEVLD